MAAKAPVDLIQVLSELADSAQHYRDLMGTDMAMRRFDAGQRLDEALKAARGALSDVDKNQKAIHQ